jgi:hypothetical protein
MVGASRAQIHHPEHSRHRSIDISLPIAENDFAGLRAARGQLSHRLDTRQSSHPRRPTPRHSRPEADHETMAVQFLSEASFAALTRFQIRFGKGSFSLHSLMQDAGKPPLRLASFEVI